MREYLILAVLDAVDSATTSVGLSSGVPEGNPFQQAAYAVGGFASMVTLKAEWSAIVFVLLVLLSLRYDRKIVVGFACWLFALAVISNLWAIGVSG